jgi:hypothetical protein
LILPEAERRIVSKKEPTVSITAGFKPGPFNVVWPFFALSWTMRPLLLGPLQSEALHWGDRMTAQ